MDMCARQLSESPLCLKVWILAALSILAVTGADDLRAQEAFGTDSTLETAELWVDPVSSQDNYEQNSELSLEEREALGSAVVIASSTLDHVPTFLDDLDTHLMSDEIINRLEDRYSMQLQFYSTQYGLVRHTEDSILKRTYYGSIEQEQAIQLKMARSIRHYMLVRGIPRFLTSKESTKFIGENYTKAVSFAQKAARVEIKTPDGRGKFNAGANPFTTKFWAKWVKGQTTIEFSDFINEHNRMAVFAVTQRGRYRPRVTYHIERKGIEPGVGFKVNRDFSTQLYTFFPLNDSNPLANAKTTFSAKYNF